jgi:integrase
MQAEIKSIAAAKPNTRTKYLTIWKKLANYLDSIGKSDALPRSISLETIRGFDDFMLTSNLTPNTMINYHRVIKKFLSSYRRRSGDIGFINPYTDYDLRRKEPTIKECLSWNDFLLLRRNSVQDSTLEKVRLKFLFQFYSGGMRVSDMMLLRFSNLENRSLTFRIKKTRVPLKHVLSDALIEVLGEYLNIPRAHKPIETNNNKIELLKQTKARLLEGVSLNLQNEIPLSAFVEEAPKQMLSYSNLLATVLSISELNLELTRLKKFIDRGGKIEIMNREIDLSELYNKYSKEINEQYNKLLKAFTHIQNTEYQGIIQELNRRAKHPKEKNDFVFDFLDREDFPTPSSALNDYQTRLIHKRTVVYNRQLKRLQAQFNIPLNITSHVARHTFANIALSCGASHTDLMMILGHSSLEITTKYLSSGFQSESKDKALMNVGKVS